MKILLLIFQRVVLYVSDTVLNLRNERDLKFCVVHAVPSSIW